MNTPQDKLKHHVTGAIERGEKQPVVEQRAHTPTPWTRKGSHIYFQAHPGGYRFDLAEVFRDVGSQTAEANSAFIIRACNAHDGLVKALKDMLEPYDEGDPHGEPWQMAQAREALRKAGAL